MTKLYNFAQIRSDIEYEIEVREAAPKAHKLLE